MDQGKPRKFNLKMALSAVAASCALGLCAYMLLPDGRPPAPAKPMFDEKELDVLADAISHPGRVTEDQKALAGEAFACSSGIVKSNVVKAVVGRSLDELRSQFKGLSTDEEKRRKVQEICLYLETKYKVGGSFKKFFDKEFIKEGVNCYLKDTTPEERALYAPVMRAFIQKLNQAQ